jgi:NADH-quinone oxidoreductase subunit C/D
VTQETDTQSSAAAASQSAGFEHEVVRELHAKFGESVCHFQRTRDAVPTIWVPRERVKEVLLFLRDMPRPFVMLYDLSAIDEQLRTHRRGQPPSDFTVFYHLLSIERNSDVRIKVALAASDIHLPSVTVFGQTPIGMSVKCGICSVLPSKGIRICRVF